MERSYFSNQVSINIKVGDSMVQASKSKSFQSCLKEFLTFCISQLDITCESFSYINLVLIHLLYNIHCCIALNPFN